MAQRGSPKTALPIRSRESLLRGGGERRRGSTIQPTLSQYYDMGDKLGSGAFSIVYECTEKASGASYAVKVMERAKLAKLREAVENEIKILSALKHPNIVELKNVYQEPQRICIVTEKLTGGELMSRLEEKGHFSEADTKEVVRQLLSALRYMHDEGVIHRDMKPENVLLKDPETVEVKVSDFGLSAFRTRDLTMEKAITDVAGTPHYMAPELLRNQSYDKTVDVWSVGVIMYLLLSGTFPFDSNSQSALFDLIQSGKYKPMEGGVWDEVSQDAKTLIRRLLKVIPSERYSVDEALNHSWLTGRAGGEDMTIVEMMRAFNAMRKLKRGMVAVYAAVCWKNLLRKK